MQILGNTVARNGRVKIGRARQIAATLVVKTAIAGKRARNLADAIGAEVEADAGIVVANGRQRPTASVGADKRHHKFVGHSLVVKILHSLHRDYILAAFALTKDHGVVGFGNALPAPVAVHRIVAAAYRGNLAAVVFTHLLLQLFEVTRPIGRQCVATVHKGVDKYTLHAL